MMPPNEPEMAFIAGLTPAFPAAAVAAAVVVAAAAEAVVALFSFADGINNEAGWRWWR